jgi:tetratricopeptide (TPR) repeat protein
MKRLGLATAFALASLAGCATTGGGAPAGPGEASAEPRGPGPEGVDPFQRDFDGALGLLDARQFVQAGEAFEACAAAHAAHPKVPLALFNGAIAWEQASRLDQAAALRQRLLAQFPGSREAEAAQPMLAALRSRQGKKEEAIALYRDFVARFADHPAACSASYNLGATLDEVRRPLEAADAYLAFGAAPRCVRADPNASASVLYRAGELFEKGGRMPEARKAYQGCVEVAGVTAARAVRLQDEARKRARR